MSILSACLNGFAQISNLISYRIDFHGRPELIQDQGLALIHQEFQINSNNNEEVSSLYVNISLAEDPVNPIQLEVNPDLFSFDAGMNWNIYQPLNRFTAQKVEWPEYAPVIFDKHNMKIVTPKDTVFINNEGPFRNYFILESDSEGFVKQLTEGYFQISDSAFHRVYHRNYTIKDGKILNWLFTHYDENRIQARKLTSFEYFENNLIHISERVLKETLKNEIDIISSSQTDVKDLLYECQLSKTNAVLVVSQNDFLSNMQQYDTLLYNDAQVIQTWIKSIVSPSLRTRIVTSFDYNVGGTVSSLKTEKFLYQQGEVQIEKYKSDFSYNEAGYVSEVNHYKINPSPKKDNYTIISVMKAEYVRR